MALSNKKILQEMERGNVVITPFNQDQLNTSSYDVKLGEYYFRADPVALGKSIYNPFNKKDVEMIWGSTKKAEPAEKILGDAFEYEGIKKDDKVILLAPGETILAHTEEFIGGRNTITTSMQARSSAGRNFITVCKCAGWGDVGYINRWTMEIGNNSLTQHIPLVVGRRIAQIVFIETGEILGNDYASEGKYQTTDNLDELIGNWDPKSILPKMYKDREIQW